MVIKHTGFQNIEAGLALRNVVEINIENLHPGSGFRRAGLKPTEVNTKKVKNVFPSKLSKYQMFQRELNDFSEKLDNKNLLLTRGNYKETQSLKKASNITTSGISTWKKINQKGILVNSTLDGFGEDYREIEDYYKNTKSSLISDDFLLGYSYFLLSQKNSKMVLNYLTPD